MKVYAIKLAKGGWAQGSYWKSTTDFTRAKLYGKLGTARQALSYHSRSDMWKGAEILAFELTATPIPLEN